MEQFAAMGANRIERERVLRIRYDEDGNPISKDYFTGPCTASAPD